MLLLSMYFLKYLTSLLDIINMYQNDSVS